MNRPASVIPAAGYTFTGWSGGLTGSTNPATITMDASKTVTATYAPVPRPVSVHAIIFTIGKATRAFVNSKVVPVILSGRSMLPLRFVAENLGFQVVWNALIDAGRGQVAFGVSWYIRHLTRRVAHRKRTDWIPAFAESTPQKHPSY